ncbi:MAG: DNA/RNA nuclease SfsA [Desulfarculales bacterium]|jgi:sugar fermentation stimulation protein A|nr:DNA/RNA nuclease SfsA [Desulfarculales bacterium]
MTASLAAVEYVFPSPLIRGVLLERRQRFLALARLPGGREETVHCPNSGAMTGCAEEGMEVALSHNPGPGRRTAYTWQLSRGGESWICVNTLLANRLVMTAARAGVDPWFQGAGLVRGEVRVSGRSRLDLLVETGRGPCYVEVKSVTLKEGNLALFPDAVTSRGKRHLDELMELKAAGKRALLLFVVNRQDVERFAPAEAIDPAYAGALARAARAGVEIAVWQCRVSPEKISLWREIPCGKEKDLILGQTN